MLWLSGCNSDTPTLPRVAGDEGVGEVMEIGAKVTQFEPGQRVVFTTRHLGTWHYYGIYTEEEIHKIPSKIPLPEASMLSVAPISAYTMLHDFARVCPGQTVVQNGANSRVGQSVIQICKASGISTINIVSSHVGYETVKDHLLSLGATRVYTLEEAEEMSCQSFERPTLAINCLGGRYDDIMLRLLESNGNIVYYGEAYNLSHIKQCVRPDVTFHQFHLSTWTENNNYVEKDERIQRLLELISMGKLKAPLHTPLLLKDYMYALRNTCNSEAFATQNYVFNFTLI